MTSESRELLIFIFLILGMIGFSEIKRGYSTITGKGYAPSFIERISDNIFRNFIQIRKEIESSNDGITKTQKLRGYNSFIGGIIFVIVSLIMLVYYIFA